ncbi:MAG: Bax inhibitor-1/YccA family protein [Rickettsiales bacterium]|nr:Bax inhibitor-1/YccA family protein [Rickettsiales bacterium]
MKDFVNVTQAKSTTYDNGLRVYMNNIYKYMSFALLITGLVSFLTVNTPFLLNLIFKTPLSIVIMLAPLLYVWYFTSKIWTMSPEKARNNLWIFAAIMGLSLTSIFLVYTTTSIVRTFFITSATFAGMSLYGYTTKKDLTGVGQFMMMGLIGIIIASVVNIFLKSAGMEFMISILGVVIFTALTAYDVQKLKRTYDYVGVNADAEQKVAIIGALNLYMDFINLFLMLLRFTGDSRR